MIYPSTETLTLYKRQPPADHMSHSKAIGTLDSRTDEEEADNSGDGLMLYRLGQVYQELGDHSKAFNNNF